MGFSSSNGVMIGKDMLISINTSKISGTKRLKKVKIRSKIAPSYSSLDDDVVK
jgi:hypothetical protein